MSDEHYPPRLIAMLESVWGQGFMSPGGADEVARVVGGHDLTAKTVLDIGCGAGGIDIALVRNHGAGYVVGLDVEGSVLTHARALIATAGSGAVTGRRGRSSGQCRGGRFRRPEHRPLVADDPGSGYRRTLSNPSFRPKTAVRGGCERFSTTFPEWLR